MNNVTTDFGSSVKATLHLSYSEFRSGGEICKGQEDVSWPDRERALVEFMPIRLNKTSEDAQWMKEDVKIDFDALEGQDVWLVVVRYSTGDTFGHVHGAWHVIGVYESEGQAEKVRKSIFDDTYQGSVNYNCDYAYWCWKGYFEKLQDVEIHQMKVYA